jgi:Protein of unknown function (DUF1552)
MITLSRRDWLRMAGVSVLLPLFAKDRADARADGERPVRLVLLMQANGTTQVRGFWPDQTGTSPILGALLDDPSLKTKTAVVRGLFNHAGGAGNQHDQGFAGLYSGVRTVGTLADPWGGGPSLDQMVRPLVVGKVPFPTLNAGVTALDQPVLKDHRTSFAYFAARQSVPTENDPTRLFTRVFAPAQDPVLAASRLAEDQSVLDFATADLARLRARLGKDERDKLDIHTTSIREYEQRLAMLAAKPPGFCSAAHPPAPIVDVTAEENVPLLMPAMIDLVAMALACDLTRVVTFPMGSAGLNWRYDWLGISKDSHAEIAHKDNGKTPAVTDEIIQIGQWHALHVARLARALDAIPEGDGTVLDNTLIVWGNELATGQHGLDGIPIVLVGKAGGRIRTTGLVDTGPQTYHRLGCSVLAAMGMPSAGFGDEATCGTIQGLTLAS